MMVERRALREYCKTLLGAQILDAFVPLAAKLTQYPVEFRIHNCRTHMNCWRLYQAVQVAVCDRVMFDQSQIKIVS